MSRLKSFTRLHGHAKLKKDGHPNLKSKVTKRFLINEIKEKKYAEHNKKKWIAILYIADEGVF